ncbi:MAG TPA: hypothetical protein PLK35_01395 [Candidatus Moranbacteria bacterium]|nr:hypothetical protein [Candidatus Moranbacteria bacterium]
MKYILGIDTTFHSSAVGLIDEEGKVIINEKVDLDFTSQEAKKFYNFHNRNLLLLLKPILEKYEKDIFLICASSLEGPFHAMPVGAVVANTISHIFEKKIMGVKHEMAHIHANWLDRSIEDFSFPIIGLNASGAHSSIYAMKSQLDITKIYELKWRDDAEKPTGLGALFDIICSSMGINLKRGDGGAHLEILALAGKSRYKEKLLDWPLKRENKFLNLENTELYISEKLKSLNYYSLTDEEKKIFQKDFSSSVLDALFDLLISELFRLAKETGAKEIHSVGGITLNKIFCQKLASFCKINNLNFKIPAKLDYCLDNGAMVAISGYMKWKNEEFSQSEKSGFLTIEPSDSYYKYYVKHVLGS